MAWRHTQELGKERQWKMDFYKNHAISLYLITGKVLANDHRAAPP